MIILNLDEQEGNGDDCISFKDAIERYKISDIKKGVKSFHDVLRKKNTIIIVGEKSFLATGLNRWFYSFQRNEKKEFKDYEAECRRKYDPVSNDE